MGIFSLKANVRPINAGVCEVSAEQIVTALQNFPKEKVRAVAAERYEQYKKMMEDIIDSLQKDRNYENTYNFQMSYASYKCRK